MQPSFSACMPLLIATDMTRQKTLLSDGTYVNSTPYCHNANIHTHLRAHTHRHTNTHTHVHTHTDTHTCTHTQTDRVDLLYDESVPALNQTSQVALALFTVRLSQDETERRGLRDGTECSQEVVCLSNDILASRGVITDEQSTIWNGLPLTSSELHDPLGPASSSPSQTYCPPPTTEAVCSLFSRSTHRAAAKT